MMQNFIFFDIDGTIISEDGYLPDSAVRAIQAARKKGNATLINTGRTAMNVDSFLREIGFDGYNDIQSKRWPNGQPNQMVARAIESGTTWMHKNRFVARAVAKTKKQAVEAMRKRAEAEIKQIMK